MTPFFRTSAALLLAALMPLARAQVTPQDLPPVDSVFIPSVKAAGRDHVDIHWTIAKGYYLYRHRMGAQVLGDGVQAGTLSLPEGAKHHDEFFGDVQTYRDGVSATLPVTVPSSGLRNATLLRSRSVSLEPTRTAPGRTKRLKWANA